MRRLLPRLASSVAVFVLLAMSSFLAARFGTGSLWKGFEPALAITGQAARAPYDLTRLEAVNETLKMIRDKYVEPDRVKPRRMLLEALNQVQREVAQVIVLPDDGKHVIVRVDTEEKKFRIDNIQGPWDVSARLREVFSFLQKHLKDDKEVDLREIEYAACNGMLRTLDPHSVFLSPEAFREMNVQTSGAFGGLGIVISIRDQLLTVMNPMPGTPAGRAGIRRFDRITKIDNVSTLNMPLDAAVQRLRGDAGTKVTIWVERPGEWKGEKPFELVREQIKVESVESRALSSGIGYTKIKTFQATTVAELSDALDKLRDEDNLKGLVLDLRGNPGGLLDQAARVSDLFLSDGVIVSTVGAAEGRDEKRARAAGTEPPYPIVVLVDGGSASASEIVAGALKNQERALVVGSQTFGKGSVQLVFPELTPDKAALKLTIAQYLTPGDLSIQGVGITPDIALDPMTVDELEMDLTVQRDEVKERDLSESLSSDNAKAPEPPEEVVRYHYSQAEREQERSRGDLSVDEFHVDFAIELARDLAARLPPNATRAAQMESARAYIGQVREQELAEVAKELEQLGIDWAAAPKSAARPRAADFDVEVSTDQPNDTVTAGDQMRLMVKVTNNGEVPIYRLRAITESENSYMDQKELVFGKLDPGETQSSTVFLGWCEIEGRRVGSIQPIADDAKRTCKIPMDALARTDGLRVRFSADQNATLDPVEIRPTVRELERPIFEYAYQIADDRGGNGDGRLQRGEKLSLYLTVRNAGKGRSFETQANLSSLSGDGLVLKKGRFDVSDMLPGDVRRLVFTFDVANNLRDNEAVLTLSVGDRDLREYATEKIRVAVQEPLKIKPADEVRVVAAGGATLFRSARVGGGGFGKLAEKTPVKVIGTINGWSKVQLEGDRYAFVDDAQLVDGGGEPAAKLAFTDVYSHAPPELDVKAQSMATKASSVRIEGLATDSERLLDLYVYVGSRKLFYQSNRDSSDKTRSAFSFDVPLRPGVNFISVVARENPDTTTRRTLVVRRDGEDGSILKSPKNEDAVEDWLGAPAK